MYFNVALYIPEMFVLAKLKDFQGGRKTCCRWRGAFGVLVSGKDRLVWGFEENCISKMPAEMRTALTANSCSSWDKAVLAKCVGFWETLETLAKNTHFLEQLNIFVTTLYWIGSWGSKCTANCSTSSRHMKFHGCLQGTGSTSGLLLTV